MKTMNLTLMLLLFAVVSFAQNVPAYVPTNGLVGWWPFNGNANDESGNGNNGTVNGATLTSDRFGNAGKAYSFDGTSNYVGVGNINNYNFYQNDFSISAWFLNNDTNVQSPRIIFGKDSACYGDIGQFRIGLIQIQNCQLEAAMSGQIGNNVIGGVTFCNSPRPSDLMWNNVIITRSQSNAKLYLNGVLLSQQSNDNQIYPLSPYNYDIYFGARKVTPTCLANFGGVNGLMNFFYGKLDDIGIWNRALDSTEITSLYNSSTNTATVVNNSASDVKIYPNPTNDHITIDAGNLNVMSGYSIRISNSLGQQMFQSAITQQQFYIDLSTWTGNGIYFVHIIDPSGNIINVKKIVLQ